MLHASPISLGRARKLACILSPDIGVELAASVSPRDAASTYIYHRAVILKPASRLASLTEAPEVAQGPPEHAPSTSSGSG
eukprot:8086945-Pyramimonas_sp.AAC.1